MDSLCRILGIDTDTVESGASPGDIWREPTPLAYSPAGETVGRGRDKSDVSFRVTKSRQLHLEIAYDSERRF